MAARRPPPTRQVADPIALLRADRAEARELADPNANLCACATVAGGEPQVRMLVLRELDGRFALFVNRSSPKHGEFAESASVQLLVYLPSLAVQYRLTCGLVAMPLAVVYASWRQRPLVPRQLDWLYAERPQSSPLPSAAWLAEALATEAGPSADAAPASAVGYYLAPHGVERLLLRQDGPHDRRRYTLAAGAWRSEALMP